MQYKPTRSPCATVAIAATLALGSTSGFAQDAGPVVAPASVAAAPAPTIVVPPVTVQPTAPQPIAPETATRTAPEPPARPAPRAQAPRPAPKAAAAPAPRAAAPAPAVPVEVAPAAPAATPAVPAETVAQTPLDNAAPAPVVEPAAQTDTGLAIEEIGFLALLAAIGAGGIALLVMSRRRRRNAAAAEAYDEYHAEEPAFVAERTPALKQPIILTPTAVRAQPVYGERPETLDRTEPTVREPIAAAPVQTTPAQSFAMPTGAVPTGDDREALLDRMVAAEPDAENPFTTNKARRRRARLILQAREAEQNGDNARSFDWRTYEPSAKPREPELA